MKYSLGKLDIEGFSPEDLPAICGKMGFDTAALSINVSSTYHLLPANHHQDPFDRMLIWEALTHEFILLSADANMKKYVSAGLRWLN